MTPVRIRGQVFRSITDAAKQIGVNPRTIHKHLDAGTIDAVGIAAPTPPRPSEIGGQTYPSMAAAAAVLGITREAVRQRLNRRLAQQVSA